MSGDPVLVAATTVSHEPVSEEARRDRKKRQTRDALIDAALELFEAKGYEHTAVHEITEAVDVAERTFFRYFASKSAHAWLCARPFGRPSNGWWPTATRSTESRVR
jgi:transcriptional regulator GlxA family with amidase domain